MSTVKAIDWYRQLPDWAKGVVVVGGLTTVVVTGVYVTKAVRDKKAIALAIQKVTGYKQDLDNLETQGVVPTYQESQYSQWADSIQQIMTGKDTSFAICLGPFQTNSTSHQQIWPIVNDLKNDADFLALQTAFASRTIDKGFFMSDFKNVTLSAAMEAQLQDCEIDHLNATMALKGIKYKF